VAFLRRRGSEDEPEVSYPAPTPATGLEPQVVSEPVPEAEPQPAVPAAAPAGSLVESQFRPVEGAEDMLDMPLGTLIFRAGLIAPQQLEDALAEGLRTGKRLGEVLLGRGWLSEGDLSRLLAGQKGLPYADLDTVAIDLDLAHTLTYEDARRELAMPLVIEFGVPVVAMADPSEDAMERLRGLLGPEIRFVVAAPSALGRRIDEVLGGVAGPELIVASAASETPAPEAAPAYEEQPLEPQPAEEPYQQPAYEEQPLEPPQPAEEPYQEPAYAEPGFQDVVPIGADGEIDYPIFGTFEEIPQPETLGARPEQLPTEVQTGELGYYEDPSLLEGSAWQAGEPGPEEVEPAPELELPLPDDAASAALPEAPAEPEVSAEVPLEEVAIEPAETVPEAALEIEPVEAAASEEASVEAQEPAAAEESAAETPGITPAWARGGVTIINAEIADFIGGGGAFGDERSAESEAEAVLSEASSAEIEPSAPVEPEPVVEPEPASESEAGGFAEPEPAIEPEPVAEPMADEPAVEGEAPLAAEAEEPGAGPSEFELVVRLSDGDRVSIGAFASEPEAQTKAREVVQQLASVEPGDWPFIGGRYLRPETIVSIDVEHHHTGWGGSGDRGRLFTGGEG
jgi:hypothetical protein